MGCCACCPGPQPSLGRGCITAAWRPAARKPGGVKAMERFYWPASCWWSGWHHMPLPTWLSTDKHAVSNCSNSIMQSNGSTCELRTAAMACCAAPAATTGSPKNSGTRSGRQATRCATQRIHPGSCANTFHNPIIGKVFANGGMLRYVYCRVKAFQGAGASSALSWAKPHCRFRARWSATWKRYQGCSPMLQPHDNAQHSWSAAACQQEQGWPGTGSSPAAAGHTSCSGRAPGVQGLPQYQGQLAAAASVLLSIC